jgi:hypothetical protein
MKGRNPLTLKASYVQGSNKGGKLELMIVITLLKFPTLITVLAVITILKFPTLITASAGLQG